MRVPSRRTVLAGGLVAAVGATASWWWARPDDDRLAASAAAYADPVLVVPADERDEPVSLSGPTIQGDELSVDDFRGEVVVLNIWGSWCGPCRTEAPVLADASRDYAPRGVAFVGVNVRDDPAAALAFEDRYGITYPSLDDRAGRAVLALSSSVPARAVPVTVVLDREGRVAARVLGAVADDVLRGLLDDVLAEPPADRPSSGPPQTAARP